MKTRNLDSIRLWGRRLRYCWPTSTNAARTFYETKPISDNLLELKHLRRLFCLERLGVYRHFQVFIIRVGVEIDIDG